MESESPPECGLPECGLVGVVRCGQCKVVWYCSPHCQADHWAQHYHRCRAPPPLEWPGLQLLESSTDLSHPPALSDLRVKERQKTEVEGAAQENSPDGKLAKGYSVKEISDDEKMKTLEKVGVKLEAAPEVSPDEGKMESKEEKEDVTSLSLYPRVLSSDKICPQKVPVKLAEVISVGSITSPTEFSINLAVEVG